MEGLFHLIMHKPRWLRWWMVFAPVLGIWILGGYGFHLYDEQASAFTAAYHSLQLFILHTPHLERDVNWPLEIARWLAVLVFASALIVLLQQTVWMALRLRQLRRIRDHVLICGLGEVGTRLALELRSNNENVVAIELEAESPNIATVEEKGVIVLKGNAQDPEVLRRAGAERAKTIMAVCTSDDTNVAVAVALKGLLEKPGANQHNLEFFLLITDPALRLELKTHSISNKFNVKIGGLYVPDLVAHQAFYDYPLDFTGIPPGSSTQAHIIVVGDCEIAQALTIKALQLGHFANGVGLKLTVVAPKASGLLTNLRKRHAYTRPWYQAAAIDITFEDPSLPERVLQKASPDEFLTVVVCTASDQIPADGQDARNFALATRIGRIIHEKWPQDGTGHSRILVHLRDKAGFASMFVVRSEEWGKNPELCSFGLVENFCNVATLLNEEQDKLARAWHARYLENVREQRDKAKKQGEPWQDRPAHKLWHILAETYRESNRLAADHLPIKLRAFNLTLSASGKPVASSDLQNHEMITTMAIMEHNRWCAEKWLDGWRREGPTKRDDDQKIHFDLVPWEELDNKEKHIDLDYIAYLTDIVARIGKVISRKDAEPPDSESLKDGVIDG